MKDVAELVRAGMDLVWPRRCAVCGGEVDRPGRHLCSGCLGRISFVPQDGCCRRCGRDVPKLDGEFLCQDCRETHPKFDRVTSVMRFEGTARDLVNAFKFRRAFYLRDDLADFLEAAVRAHFQVDKIGVVTAMPATWKHRFMRGYNQCEVLAKELASRLGVVYAGTLTRRIGNPRRQGELDETERRTNVIGTFAPSRNAASLLSDLKGSVFVVDDVMTTGATLSECANVLKSAGARKVWAVTLARSVRM